MRGFFWLTRKSSACSLAPVDHMAPEDAAEQRRFFRAAVRLRRAIIQRDAKPPAVSVKTGRGRRYSFTSASTRSTRSRALDEAHVRRDLHRALFREKRSSTMLSTVTGRASHRGW